MRINLPSSGRNINAVGVARPMLLPMQYGVTSCWTIQMRPLAPAPFARCSQAWPQIPIHDMSITATNFFP